MFKLIDYKCDHSIGSYVALLTFLARQQDSKMPSSGKKVTIKASPPIMDIFESM